MSNEHHLSILELCGLPLNITHIELLAKVIKITLLLQYKH